MGALGGPKKAGGSGGKAAKAGGGRAERPLDRFPGKAVCPFGNEAVWDATQADLDGSEFMKAIRLLRTDTGDKKKAFSLRLWYATPPGMHVCRLCQTIVEGGFVHYECSFLVSVGVIPPEPPASALVEVVDETAAAELIKSLKVVAGGSGSTGDQGSGGPGATISPLARKVEMPVGGSGVALSVVDKEAELVGRAVAEGSPQGRSILEALKTVIDDLAIVGGEVGVPGSDESRAEAAKDVWRGMPAGVTAFLRASEMGRDILSRARNASGVWLSSLSSTQLQMILGRLRRLQGQVEGDWAARDSKKSAGGASAGDGASDGVARVVPTSLDMSESPVGTVMALSKVEYIRLPGSLTGVALGKRETSGTPSHVMLVLRLGIPGAKVDYRGVAQYLATAASGVVSAGSAEAAWKATAIQAMQGGLVPPFTGTLAGTSDGRSERWSAAFRAYKRFLAAHHVLSDPLVRDVHDLKSGVLEGVREHGVVLVDAAWSKAAIAYNRLCGDVATVAMATCNPADPSFVATMGDSVWPSLGVEFKNALLQEVLVARLSGSLKARSLAAVEGSGGSVSEVKGMAGAGSAGKGATLGGGAVGGADGAGARDRVFGSGRGREDVKRRPCWNGVHCLNPGCTYLHPEAPAGRGKRGRGSGR